MTRFAWLQSRTQTLIAAAALAALAVAAAITGVQLSHLYNSLVAHCQSSCDLATQQFLSHDHFLDRLLDPLAQVTPALIGIFWGAPLLTRELETGTYRLAWTQSVTRSRWLVTKLGLVGLATVTIAGLLTLTITWWYRALDSVSTNQYAVFDRRDIAPIGYAAFAFASGALIGAVIRRTLPAMATTLGTFVFVRIATTLWVRPHLLTPLHKTMSLLNADHFGIASINGSSTTLVAQGSAGPNAWTLSSKIATNTGHIATAAERTAFVHQYCPNVGPPPGPPSGHAVVGVAGADARAGEACSNLAARTFHLLVTYQPASRYWTFQWLETGIFLALALLAAIACYWWVTRRTA
jgi:ABC-type transport system involved in multi-copper enzyme maturation permease subunit